MRLIASVIGLLVFSLATATVGGDEGYFRPQDLPKDYLKERYNFVAPDGFFTGLRAATLSLGDQGGAGVLVSKDGLVATSNHLIRDHILRVGEKGRVVLEEGFLALRRDREIAIPGLRVQRFLSETDVSTRLEETVAARLKADAALSPEAARDRAIQDLVEAETTRTGLICRVSAPQDAKSQALLQRFASHDDIRLVFCPELSIAAFGGDRDNFHFPRYWFDLVFLRIYENGEPFSTPEALDWDLDGVEPDDFVILAGMPAENGRFTPPEIVRHSLETNHPVVVRLYDAIVATLYDFAQKGHREAGLVTSELAALENARKAYSGRMESMLNDSGLAHLEQRWRDDLGQLEAAELKDINAQLEPLRQELLQLTEAAWPLRLRRLFSRLDSHSLARAKDIVSYARALTELERDDPRILELRAGILSPFEVEADLEAAIAATRLELARQELGPEDPFVVACNNVVGDAGMAAAFAKSALTSQEFRAAVVDLQPSEILGLQDPLIRLALELQPIWSELWSPEGFQNDKKIAIIATQIARICGALRVERFGPAPDGSFRLSFGEVKGFARGGSDVPAVTNIWGLFGRNRAMRDVEPFQLPRSFLQAKSRLNLDRNMNFALTADAGQGSSGGPVLNSEGRVVGLLFDLSYERLGQHFGYGSDLGRGIALDSGFVLEVLRRVYDAHALADELLGERSFK